MKIFFDSKNIINKAPFGCIEQGENCMVRIIFSHDCCVKRAFLLLSEEGAGCFELPMQKENGFEELDGYAVCFSLQSPGLYFYYFRAETDHGCFEVKRSGYDGTSVNGGICWQLTCYDKAFSVPESFHGCVFYQIFPDRFFKAGEPDLRNKLRPFAVHRDWHECPEAFARDGRPWNTDFFGGNLRGVEAKLEYLKSLHIEAIYFNPLFMAHSNHRYDTADYLMIDPMLGSEADFAALCCSAHSAGIKIILDGVFSHTGSNSIYFDKNGIFGCGAYACKDSLFRGWYNFHDGGYDSWWGIDTLPAVNEQNPKYVEFIATGENSVIKRWLRLGADGFRLDVADELPDEFIAIIRAAVKQEKPNALLIGEVWEDASNKISYGIRRKYLQGAELDTVMNYPFMTAILDFVRGIIDAARFSQSVMAIAENYPYECVMTLLNSLGTHDTWRALTVLGDADPLLDKESKAAASLPPDKRMNALKRFKTASLLQFTLPGCPCIYYGDEAGLEGYEDPFNRRTYPWGEEDEELLSYFRRLTEVRSFVTLRKGDIRFLRAEGGFLKFQRCTHEETAEITVNALEHKGQIKVNGKTVFEI